MKTVFTLVVCFLLSLMAYAQATFKEKITTRTKPIEFVKGELYIKLKNVKTFTKANSNVNIADELGFLEKVSSEVTLLSAKKPFFSSTSEKLQQIYRIKVDTNSVSMSGYIKLLSNHPEIDYVERIAMIKLESTPNDPFITYQNYLNQIKAFQSWDIGVPVRQVKVAIVDNAVQANHRDLVANMLPGYDVADDDTDPSPPNDTFYHGTHVAGIAGAVTNNGRGIASPSNNSVKIIPVKVTSDSGDPGFMDTAYEGIVWAADNGANIINCSWGGGMVSNVGREVINYIESKGCILVASGGNDDYEGMFFPACYSGVVAVASVDMEDVKSGYSNYGHWIDIAAPGNNIASTIPTNKYGYLSGTSMAAPVISACLGYIWACYPMLSKEELVRLMQRTADDISTKNPDYLGKLGAGRVNLQNAISCMSQGYQTIATRALSTQFFCQGLSVILEATTVSEGEYHWYKNDTLLIGVGRTVSVKEEGMYKVRFSMGNCTLISESMKVGVTTLKSSIPQVSNMVSPYCSMTEKGLLASIDSTIAGTKTFSYKGGKLGYDNLLSSNPDPNEYDVPTIEVSGMAGFIKKISVAIAWEKKNQLDANSCDLEDLGGSSRNDEIYFALYTPSGKHFILQFAGTYEPGTSSTGVVTTVFEDGASYQNYGSEIVASGIFAPQDLFSGSNNDNPNGIWQLIPIDDGEGNPLCVSGFSVTITSNVPSQQPTIVWWDAQGKQIQQGNELLLSNATIGIQKFMVGSQSEGFCPSEKVATQFEVKPVPEIAVFPIDETLSTQLTSYSILSEKNIQYKKDKSGNTILYYEENGRIKEVNLGDVSPLTNPITLCSTSNNYLIIANGCPNNIITWSNGQNGQNLIVKPSSTIGYNAYCHQNWNNCPPIISNLIHFITTDHHPYPIVDEIKANNIQKFVQNNIVASNRINTPAKVDYRGIKSIELNPGFQVEGNSVFKAEIKGCND